ncbi:Long-chain-fatty-acid--CoA ligase [Burkholderia sp. lig30]|uniref:AMP-binding protein n=1 Tax=Burkholderia sp. lig30 TaxID=1192124 RepID=UPI00046129C7|nr:AMP-binding protein [Burkholderia sp. lig30]KDB08851.1 Long-chain-fatty-acid--CoA ligase [Burkholderia sp. lig30]
MSTPAGRIVPKPKLLALHGRGSNGDVTRLQINNLGLSESDYEIRYVDGPITSSRPGPGVEELEGLVSGPWYSWLPENLSESASGNEKILADAICAAVEHVLSVLESEGPFDGIYGFSQGGVIAGLVNNLLQDDSLLSLLKSRSNRLISPLIQEGLPFRAVVIACAGSAIPLPELRSRAGLGEAPSVTSLQSRIIHLIGIEDEYKSWSESLAATLNSPSTDVFYLSGAHEINRQRHDGEVCEAVRQCLNGDSDSGSAPGSRHGEWEWKKSSSRSHRAVARHLQISAVNVETDGLPETIVEMLAAQPADAPLFRHAREENANACATYGQVLAFSRPGGDGDLRRLGVRAGEVVAYVAPPGGNATAAVAFISIASQTCAAPFNAGMSEADTLLALEQFDVRHMILFEEVAAPGVRSAFEIHSKNGRARIHFASSSAETAPGLYRYKDSVEGFETSPVLFNPRASPCLLLRTSGSTSTPKVVPLRQRDLVWNAAILADGIGINASDVTYSIMPLDHIGGISASILCSVAVGASITCDGLYNPQGMVEALSRSNPKPTWYSAVPTIHNATARYLRDNAETYLSQSGTWPSHHLRVIRSGAAELKEVDRQLLETTYGCEVVTTYGMSEQMPISQPPRSETGWLQQPGSVGVPVTASMAVVDSATLRPLPFGVVGEVALSGPTVFSGYLNNQAANRQSRFLLKSHEDGSIRRWFLTGDLGEMNHDGTLSLRGRIKEMIKRGGEQISPFEIENILARHPWVGTPVCFPVPSDVYGEEVGCALVLKSSATLRVTDQDATKEVREFLRKEGLAPHKLPAFIKLVQDEDLPKTSSRKYIRNGLAEVLGMGASASKKTPPPAVASGAKAASVETGVDGKPNVDWSAIAGLRFLLACYVMFMHIGSDQSWGAFANLRQFPWHVHAFFVVAGFSLTVFMPSLITRKASFVWARISTIYPLYAFAVFLALINLVPNCQPSTFSSVFHWNSQSGDVGRLFCEGTPIFQGSWMANLVSTLAIYLTGLSATPLWSASWFLGFYLWFISMYFQCLVVFPFLYNALLKSRGNTKRLILLTAGGLGVNVLILLGFWYGYAADATGYGFFDRLTGEKIVPTAEQAAMADKDNAVMLGFYLFAPFWMVYFAAGMCAAFLYDAIRPSEQRRAYIWGYIADAITVLIIVVSVAHVAQGYIPHGPSLDKASLETFFLRPEAADNFADPGIVNRIWDEVNSRLFAPFTLLWVFALSTGQGMTARILRLNPVSQVLAPTAYACFLFHQMVGQWYYAITRNGEWWNWWSHRKDFYWFSPQPVPVEWYEYFYVVGLVVLFGKLVQPADGVIRRWFGLALSSLRKVGATSHPEKDTMSIVLRIVQRTTGMEAKPEWSLEECGLASLGIVQFASALQAECSTSSRKVSLSVADIMSARSIREVADIVDAARNGEFEPQGRVLQAT